MQQNSVLVLGANGRMGAAAVRAFANAGWRVIAQVRREVPNDFGAKVQTLAIPLDETARIADAAQGVRTVVYAINPIYTEWEDKLLPLANLGMDIAARLDATFMLPGNVYNFGENMPSTLGAKTPEHPSTRKGELRCQLENAMRARCSTGLCCMVIRAGDFYGAGSGSWMDQMVVKDIARGKLVYPGPLNVPHAWAYLPDLGQAFVALASKLVKLDQESKDEAVQKPGRFGAFCFAGHTLTGEEFLSILEVEARLLGLRPKKGFRRAAMPWGFIKAVGYVYPLWRELARMSYLWRVSHRLDGTSLEEFVGALQTTEPNLAIRGALTALGVGSSELRNSSGHASKFSGFTAESADQKPH
jgi:nucleoside-diphosphate-sugar epimerase